MNKLILFFSLISILFFSGCSTIDKEERLTGIVDACYTAYEYNQRDDIEPYLKSKVQDGEISEETKIVIIKCIERGEKKK